MDLKITYLINSGFLVEGEDFILVFDDYREPEGTVARALASGKRAYVFASHAHFDHFDRHILSFAPKVSRYIFGYDIRHAADARKFPAAKTVYMETYQDWEDEAIDVQSFDSTDAGVSFLVTWKRTGTKIFHAGDFNWWDWTGEDARTRHLAENGFKKQLKRLAGLTADVAFFPVDGRLGPSMEKGAKEFVRVAQVRNLIAMHSVGFPAWEPSAGFFPDGAHTPVWAPTEAGETRVISC